MKYITATMTVISLILSVFAVTTCYRLNSTTLDIENSTVIETDTVTELNSTSEEKSCIAETTEELTSVTVKSATEKQTTTKTETTNKNADDSQLFHITVYIPSEKWGYTTYSGETAKHLQTCAVDPSVIPLGSTVYVNGLKLRANDTGSAVKGNDIDIFYDGTAKEAMAWISSFGDYHTVVVEEN